MRCRICGNGGEWCNDQRQALCATCLKDTPPKVSRGAFDKLYWGLGMEEVPDHVRRHFYEDFLASTLDVEAYVSRAGGRAGSRPWLSEEASEEAVP